MYMMEVKELKICTKITKEIRDEETFIDIWEHFWKIRLCLYYVHMYTILLGFWSLKNMAY